MWCVAVVPCYSLYRNGKVAVWHMQVPSLSDDVFNETKFLELVSGREQAAMLLGDDDDEEEATGRSNEDLLHHFQRGRLVTDKLFQKFLANLDSDEDLAV